MDEARRRRSRLHRFLIASKTDGHSALIEALREDTTRNESTELRRAALF